MGDIGRVRTYVGYLGACNCCFVYLCVSLCLFVCVYVCVCVYTPRCALECVHVSLCSVRSVCVCAAFAVLQCMCMFRCMCFFLLVVFWLRVSEARDVGKTIRRATQAMLDANRKNAINSTTPSQKICTFRSLLLNLIGT